MQIHRHLRCIVLQTTAKGTLIVSLELVFGPPMKLLFSELRLIDLELYASLLQGRLFLVSKTRFAFINPCIFSLEDHTFFLGNSVIRSYCWPFIDSEV